MQDDVRAALARIAIEWDKAEKLMKLAEKVRAEVVLPSVNELRYAGRRLVDAWSVAHAAETDQEKRTEFDGYTQDALFRCHCAQHDAIDATVLFVQSALNQYETDFGLGPLTTYFPDVADLRLRLAEAGDLIVNSRHNRGQRAAEYDKLAAEHLPTITLTYRKIQTNRPALEAMVKATASTATRDASRFRWGIAWLFAAAIFGAIATVGIEHFSGPPAAANTPSTDAKPGARAQLPSPARTLPR